LTTCFPLLSDPWLLLYNATLLLQKLAPTSTRFLLLLLAFIIHDEDPLPLLLPVCILCTDNFSIIFVFIPLLLLLLLLLLKPLDTRGE
jgi:hypothetical protein